MSHPSLEVVRGHVEAFQRRDVDGALSFLDPFVVLDQRKLGGIGIEPSHGHLAVARSVMDYWGAFEAYTYEVEQLRHLGAGVVLALVNSTGRGKTSGVPVRLSAATLYSVLDGKIVRITLFPDEEQALAAAGLPE